MPSCFLETRPSSRAKIDFNVVVNDLKFRAKQCQTHAQPLPQNSCSLNAMCGMVLMLYLHLGNHAQGLLPLLSSSTCSNGLVKQFIVPPLLSCLFVWFMEVL